MRITVENMAGSLSNQSIALPNLSSGSNKEAKSWLTFLSVASGVCTVGAIGYTLIKTAPCRAMRIIKNDVRLLKQLRQDERRLGTELGVLRKRRHVAAELGHGEDAAMLDMAIQSAEASATSADAAAKAQFTKVQTMIENYKQRFGGVEDAVFAVLGEFWCEGY